MAPNQPESSTSSVVPDKIPWHANDDKLIKDLITLMEEEENRVVIVGRKDSKEVMFSMWPMFFDIY